MVARMKRAMIARTKRYAKAIMADSMMFSPFILFFLLDIKWFFSNRKYDFSDLPILLRGLWFPNCDFDDTGFLFPRRGHDCTELRSD